MRHAKSDWHFPELTDIERPLNKRGRAAAVKMGAWLDQQELVPEMLVVSPAVRAQETVEYLFEGWDGRLPVETQACLYPGSPQNIAAALGWVPDDITTVMVIGHNPSVETFVDSINRSGDHFPTAAIADIVFDELTWQEASRAPAKFLQHCRVHQLWRPRELFPADSA